VYLLSYASTPIDTSSDFTRGRTSTFNVTSARMAAAPAIPSRRADASPSDAHCGMSRPVKK
jgi:hypothetical protein